MSGRFFWMEILLIDVNQLPIVQIEVKGKDISDSLPDAVVWNQGIYCRTIRPRIYMQASFWILGIEAANNN